MKYTGIHQLQKTLKVEKFWRCVLKIEYFTFERDLSKPISKASSLRASAFYGTQVSICGPVCAYSLRNKRAKIKFSLIYIVADLLPKICAN